MKATTRIRHSDKPSIVHISSPVNTGSLGEIYDAVRYKNGNTIVRAGKDPADHWYLYMPKKENKLAAKTYKAASIQRHRQAMKDLLIQSSDAVNSKDWMGVEQRKMIMSLRDKVAKKDVVHEDFSAREISTSLKPLSNQVRTRKRLEKTSALKSAVSPKLKSRKDYMNLFLKMSDSDLQIMRQALFPAEKAIFFEEQKLILKRMFTLISIYIKKEDSPSALADLVHHSPHKDLLLKFANAWIDHVKKSQSHRCANLLVVFSWQKTMTSICETIAASATQQPGSTVELTSPDRSRLLEKKFFRYRNAMDGGEPDSPTKLPSLPGTPIASLVSVPILTDSPVGQPVTLEAVGKFRLADDASENPQTFSVLPGVTAQPTSMASLPDLGSADVINAESPAPDTNQTPHI